jgi:hypothetical protein
VPVTAAVVISGLCTVVAVTPAGAASPTHDEVGQSVCRDDLGAAGSWGMTRAELMSGKVTILGATSKLAPTGFDLRTAPAAFADPARTLWWRSGVWIVPAFYPPAVPSDTALREAQVTLLSHLLRALAANPDPGTTGSTRAGLVKANAAGWDEGTNLRREQSLNCLLWSTGFDARLRPYVAAAARANLDPNRYAGPPLRPVQNHGTMANLTLIDSADLTDTAAWGDTAATRLHAELRGLFSPAGFTFEQSTAYLDFNAKMWETTLLDLAERPDAPDLTQARALVRQARVMEQYLTTPQGALTRIGDGDPVRPPVLANHRFLGVADRVGGVAANRWSWSDPTTTHYVVRFGPPQRGHGHLDHGSVTFSTLGVPVLVHPGYYSYATSRRWGCTGADALGCYARGPLGANVAYPTAHGALAAPSSSPLISMTRTGKVDSLVLVDNTFTTPIRRTLRIDDAHHAVTVTDTSSVSLTQRFHLDRAWVFASRTNRSLSFRNGARRLTVSVASRGIALNVFRGSTRNLAGWYFPSYGTAVSSYEVVVSGGRSVASTLTVS